SSGKDVFAVKYNLPFAGTVIAGVTSHPSDVLPAPILVRSIYAEVVPSQMLVVEIVHPGTFTASVSVPFNVLNVVQVAGIPPSKSSTNWPYPLLVNNRINIVDKSKNLFIRLEIIG